MALRFTVLASGSTGNATVLEANGFGVLIDAGVGPRILTQRLAAVGLSWQNIQSMVLTHTHSDHWKEQNFLHLFRRRIPLYCHAEHQCALRECSAGFRALHTAKLVHAYEAQQRWRLAPGLDCKPFPLSHDGGATFGFRFEINGAEDQGSAAVAYVADLGTWTAELIEHLRDVDILAVEFNHDVEMEKNSGRSGYLIARVLGDQGHLSNEQAADLVREVLANSELGRVQHLVQLHLSRDCNRPALAVAAAQKAFHADRENPTIHTARHNDAGPTLLVPDGLPRMRRSTASRQGAVASFRSRPLSMNQPFLPGWEAS